MASFNSSLVRIRRFLRDIDGKIWTDDFLRRAFNNSQYEIAQKAGLIERVDAYRYPPQYTYCYLHDWEIAHTEGDRYQALTFWQSDGKVICYPWEPVYWNDSINTQDDGYRFTIPMEGVFAEPADAIPLPLHAQFYHAKFAAYDRLPVEPVSQKELAEQDRFYRTHKGGRVYRYYRPDNFHNQIVLYPRPASVTWQEWSVGDTFSDTGGIVTSVASSIDYSDVGIITDTIDIAGALLMVYEILPTEVDEDAGSWDDDLDWPDYFMHYIEAATLERGFGADTDGFIPSLRDYWKGRKDMGIKAIQLYRRKRLLDRDITFGSRIPERSRRLRLPDGYPPVWP